MIGTPTSSPAKRPIPPRDGFFCGLLMGAADAIPGVSGGTIALILGIYERFLEAISSLVRAPSLLRTPEGRRECRGALTTLIPLGVGVVIALAAVTKLLVGSENDTDALLRSPATAPLCFGFFSGLVLFSIPEPWSRLRSTGPTVFAAAALGFLGAWIFCGLPQSQSPPAPWMLLYGGAGAISVMLLPGVSGSLFLVMVGQYQTVVQALHDRNLVTVGIFLAGILLGLALFVPILRWLLRTAHDATMAALVGLMAGSLRALWPWKAHYDPKVGTLTNLTPTGDDPVIGVIVAAIIGAATVRALALLERRLRAAP